MEVVHPRCAGLDVHKRTVVACRLIPGPGADPAREVRTFGTTTRELLALADWLAAADVSHVAMESTGSFWKPVYNILEADSSCSSSTRPTSRPCRGARPTSATPSGSPISSATASCGRASSRPGPNATCAS